MTRTRVSTGSPFEKQAGYVRAVAQGDWCFVSGTTGYDYAAMQMPDSVTAQTQNALATIAQALEQCGFSRTDIVRVTYIVPDAAFQHEVFAVTGPWFAGHEPAATMIVAGLVRPEMKVEIEVTALRKS